MAIVKMKGLRLLAMRSDREALLELLQGMGCVEVEEASQDPQIWQGLLSQADGAALSQPDGQALSQAREDLQAALAHLRDQLGRPLEFLQFTQAFRQAFHLHSSQTGSFGTGAPGSAPSDHNWR